MNLVAEFQLSYANLHNYTRHIPFPNVIYKSLVLIVYLFSTFLLSSVCEMEMYWWLKWEKYFKFE